MSMAMLPLVVVISHFSSPAQSGTFTLPLVLCVTKVLSERIDPFTEPLVVSILMAPPSHPSSATPPLMLLAYTLLSAMTSVSSIRPDVDWATIPPLRMWASSTLPLMDFAVSVSGEAFSMVTLPLVLSA